MKKIISLILSLAVLAGCAFALSSCGAPEDGGPQISVYLGEKVYDFDPTDYCVDSNAEQVISLLFEPLFSVNEKGSLKNAAASGYDVDEENRTIVIQLRETYWSDSVRVTADDFINAWRNLLVEPNRANPAVALLYDIENAVEIKNGTISSIYEFGAVASDIYEITIKYREGADYKQLLKNLSSVATAPVREDIVKTSNAGYWTKLVNTAVTNGPFKIDTIEAESFTVTRNTGYHQNPAVTDYTENVTPDQLYTFNDTENASFKVTYADLENKVVFYMGDATLADRAANKDNAIVADDLSTYTYVFNTENPLFAIREVRAALSMAIDREAIIEAVTFGKAATGFLPDNVVDTATGKSFSPDALIATTAKLDAARELLKDVDFTGISKSFSLTVNNDEESVAIANLVKAAWGQLGFNVTVNAVGVTEHTIFDSLTETDTVIKDSEIQLLAKKASRGERNFDVLAVDWQMYSKDAFVALSAFAKDFSGCGVDFSNGHKVLSNISGWQDSDYDALIEAAYGAQDKTARSEALTSAEKMLVESACIVPIKYNQSFAFVSEDISGVSFDGLGNISLTKASQKNYKEYLKDY